MAAASGSNPVALFTHCLTQHVTPQRLMYEIFSALSKSCIHTFVEGSADRHAYFIKTQREYNNDEVPLHLVGLSDMRWNCRANSLRRLSKEKVLQAVIATIDHVSSITTEGSVRGTAAGLIA